MVELDFSNIYNQSGKIVQLRYAQKAASKGSTILAMRNSNSVVLIVSKPVVSKLYVHESDHRIRKVADNIYMAYTGLLPGCFFIAELVKRSADNYRSRFQTEVSTAAFREYLGSYLYMLTEHGSARAMGANFLAIARDGGDYKIFCADCSGKVAEYYGFACGSGERRAQTEIEKMDFEAMDTKDLIDQGIKTLFKCHDSLSDTQFNIEVGVMSEDSDGQFVRVDQRTIDQIADKYKDISIDGED